MRYSQAGRLTTLFVLFLMTVLVSFAVPGGGGLLSVAHAQVEAVPETVAAVESSETEASLIDPDFVVPDYSDKARKLERTLKELVARFKDKEKRKQKLSGSDLYADMISPDQDSGWESGYHFEVRAVEYPDHLPNWAALYHQYLREGNYEAAMGAAYRSYELSSYAIETASTIFSMGQVALAQGDSKLGLNLFRKGLELANNESMQNWYQTLLERYDLKIVNIAVDLEKAQPNACLVFSALLPRDPAFHGEDYVSLSEETDLDISVAGERICLNGLEFGKTYEVTVKAGLPGEEGGKLYQATTRSFKVGDMRSRILLGRDNYVLPAQSNNVVPLKTVNHDDVQLSLYRIGSRNLDTVLIQGLLSSDLNAYMEQEIEYNSGMLVWQGTVEIASQANREVVTNIPLDGLFETKSEARKPGIYALVASPADRDEETRWQAQATQWLVVSDLGLTSFTGADGLHVFTRSLESAEALEDVTLELVARNNEILGTLESDDQGMVSFAPGLLRGKGGNSPAYLTARSEKGDYNFIQLDGPALDLSERGVSGRQAPQSMDAFLFTERGVYRPGETVRLSAILRDAEAKAAGNVPLTLRVMRPGGVELWKKTITSDGQGGLGLDIPISGAARSGTWQVTAHLGEDSSILGSVGFQVEDFVPQRMAVELSNADAFLTADSLAKFQVEGKFYFGPPAADLKGELAFSIEANPTPYPAYKDYQFGEIQEGFVTHQFTTESFRTDAAGKASISRNLEGMPEVSTPLQAVFMGSIFDSGGRPVTGIKRIPIRPREVEVGLKPRFTGSLGENEEAVFDVLALSREGEVLEGRKIAYQWVEELYDYNWYWQNGSWYSRSDYYDKPFAAGEVTSDKGGMAEISQPLGYGRYRLDIRDADGTSTASYRFYAGWWSASDQPNTPDQLELTLSEKDLEPGKTIKAFVRAPFEGKALVSVVNERLRYSEVIDLDAEGSEVEIDVEDDWGPGAYVMVTAFRPEAGKVSLLPIRAMGLEWFSIGRKNRELAVEITAPEVTLPRQSIDIPLQVKKLSGEKLSGSVRVVLAAVDEGILALTGYQSPDPAKHFLGQRSLGLDIRDIYGRLIRSEEGALGELRSGGDGVALQNTKGTNTRTVKTVALFERDVELDAKGQGVITLELPDFAGQLRLMAVAYSSDAVGSDAADMIVRDPVVADLLLPRFLAPGDEAETTLSVHNLSGGDQKLMVSFNYSDGVELSNSGKTGVVETASQKTTFDIPPFIVKDGGKRDIVLPLRGKKVGDAKISMQVTAEKVGDPETPALSFDREWDIAVRAAQPFVTDRLVSYLKPGEKLNLNQEGNQSYLPGTAEMSVTLATRPDFDVPGLLEELNHYPYGCTEQTVSASLPLLYLADVAEQWDQDLDRNDLRFKVDSGIARVLERQRPDGSFATWHGFGSAQPWLTAYTFDFLTRAREQGYEVPTAAYNLTRTWLKGYLEDRYSPDPRSHVLVTQAYGYYVLARTGDVRASEVRYFAEQNAGNLETRLAKGQLAAALAITGEKERAGELFASAMTFERPWNQWYHDYGSDLRDGAALLALMSENLDDTQKMQEMGNAVEEIFTKRRYFSTQEQAWLLQATHAMATAPQTDMTVTLNGEEQSPRRAPLYLRREVEQMAQELDVINSSEGSLRVIRSIRGVPSADLPAVEEGFRIKRRYYSMDGEYLEPEKLKQNDLLVVEIEGHVLGDSRHEALVVDLLPAGFEIENSAIGNGRNADELEFLGELSFTEFVMARDDRYVAAINLWGDQTFKLAYIVRAVTPGRFVQPGVFIEDMYQPQFHARGEMAGITVEK
ncbi:alpha-2-macroglobulin family protein [Kiloniella laminariae]|uniref:alpha-2-macroglobulin family protein n=1 Tax=Kiloniella laminariae TaxID=454162 RepID=UPI00036D5CFE|nr:alpha-2-macroglobulin [Kiloniella laminariae]